MAEVHGEGGDHTEVDPKHMKYIQAILAEKNQLGQQMEISNKLLQEELDKTKAGMLKWNPRYVDILNGRSSRVVSRVTVPTKEYPKFNFVGKLLGPKGSTLKQLQEDTKCKMSVLGRGSMKDRAKEDELRNSLDPKFAHLSEDLHVEVVAFAPPAEAYARVAYALAELRKYLTPDMNDEISAMQFREMGEFYASEGGPGGEEEEGFEGAPLLQQPTDQQPFPRPSPRGRGGFVPRGAPRGAPRGMGGGAPRGMGGGAPRGGAPPRGGGGRGMRGGQAPQRPSYGSSTPYGASPSGGASGGRPSYGGGHDEEERSAPQSHRGGFNPGGRGGRGAPRGGRGGAPPARRSYNDEESDYSNNGYNRRDESSGDHGHHGGERRGYSSGGGGAGGYSSGGGGGGGNRSSGADDYGQGDYQRRGQPEESQGAWKQRGGMSRYVDRESTLPYSRRT